MKKIALALGFLFALQRFGLAQGEFRFGLQASPTWSWLRTNERLLEGAGTNWGLKFGVSGEYYFAQNYAFTAGLGFGFNHGGTLLFANGAAQDSISIWPNAAERDNALPQSLGTGARFHYRLTYVEIPFGLRFRGGSNEDSRIKFYAEAPIFTLGFLSKALGDIRGTAIEKPEDVNIKEDVHKLSLSWGVGAGIEYEAASNATIIVGLFFQQQFTDMTSDDSQILQNGTLRKDNSKGAFNALSLKLGFFF